MVLNKNLKKFVREYLDISNEFVGMYDQSNQILSGDGQKGYEELFEKAL